jgi:hypothetical protein
VPRITTFCICIYVFGCLLLLLLLLWKDYLSTAVYVKLADVTQRFTQGIYFDASERKSVTTDTFLCFIKNTERPGFGLYSHHQAVQKRALRNSKSREGKGLSFHVT